MIAAAGFWRVSKLVAPQLRDVSLSWKGDVGDLVPVYYPSRRRKNYVSCIISDIDFSSLSAELTVMEAMWQKT